MTLRAARRQVAAVLLLGSALLAGCSKPAPPEAIEAPRPVRTQLVAASSVAPELSLAGEVRPRVEVRYGFRVGGRVLERKVQVGDRVEAGQVLARLDPSDLAPALDAQRAQQEALRTELALARADLERAERLRQGNFVSDANVQRQRAAVDAARSRLQAATAQVEQARNTLEHQLLKADAAGIVTAVDAEAGQVVAVGQSVVRVAQAGDVEVLVNVPERDLSRVREGTSWTVTLAGIPGRQWLASLRELSPAADPASRTYAARLSLRGDTAAVALGMSAVATAEGAGGSHIQVPITALHSREGTAKVWIVDPATATVQSRPVTLGALLDDAVVIEQGLRGGETVVTAGANLLREGQKVRAAASSQAAAR
ncbi:MAG: efflux RND transporter periplasmic adaptor subunit [Burkholderiaceae bacterium]|nr:efflux RND transporter periplasmic adaptor subunit [Burkholderiaceae bacterium]